MSENRTGTSDWGDFFREEAAGILGLVNEAAGADEASRQRPPDPIREPPALPAADAAPDDERKAYWRTLRTFFRSGKGGGIPRGEAGFLAYPALLSPFRDRPLLQQHFPLWMADDETAQRQETVPAPYLPLSGLLSRSVQAFAPGANEARILKDNLLRLERRVRDKLRLVDAAFKAYPILQEALRELVAELAVKGPEGDAFAGDVAQLAKQLPRSGVLIPFSAAAPLHILAAYLPAHLTPRRRAIAEAIRPLLARLNDILAVEREKNPAARSAEKLHASLDFADAFLRFDELSAVLPGGGPLAMPEERYHRIGNIIETLTQADAILFNSDAALIIDRTWATDPAGPEWPKLFPGSNIHWVENGTICRTGWDIFDSRMAEAARLFAAMRMANLEIENQFVADVHNDFFTHFDWHSFTAEELAACPPVLILTTSASLAQTELNDFSHLLASGRPLGIVALQRDDNAGGAVPEEVAFRQEPGALAIAHRNAYVLQTAAIDPLALLDGLEKGLTASLPALFHVRLPASARTDDFLRTAAAVEGRECPAFRYDSRQAPRWGSRFDIGMNPQPDADWPGRLLSLRDAGGNETTLPAQFTFADYAALLPGFAHQFHLVPPRFWSDDLVALADYLALPPARLYARVPFIWMVDSQNNLQKAAVSQALVRICRERLDFWHFLQENAGIHSYHVEQATEHLRRELEAAYEHKLAELNARHQQELETVREETGRAVMEQLAARLLDLEPLGDLVAPVPAPPVIRAETSAPPPPTAPPAAASAEPAAAEVEEVLPPGEAWIETPLCTSCNECRDLNPRIFRYNAEKQAYVADPRGGPFADIVRAAEKCPARIIHPGAPQNPNEPGLEEWIKRAEPFNR